METSEGGVGILGTRGAVQNRQPSTQLGDFLRSRRVPLDINLILATFEAAERDAETDGRAAERALQLLDRVAISIDPEQDHDYVALLDAARRRVRSTREGEPASQLR